MAEHARKLPLVEQGAQDLGVRLTEKQLGQLGRLTSELLSWTARVNLTGITDPQEVEIKHVLDSLVVVPTLSRILDRAGRLIDVGTGAGFPGLVLAISLPTIDVTVLEATQKKVAFLDHVIEMLPIPNAHTAHARAEDLARSAEHRESYDVAVARAVGSVSTLVELLVPFVQVGGWALLMKTLRGVGAELESAQHALQTMGCVVEDVVSVDLSGLLEGRALVIVRKLAATQALFPRRSGVPQRRPL